MLSLRFHISQFQAFRYRVKLVLRDGFFFLLSPLDFMCQFSWWLPVERTNGHQDGYQIERGCLCCNCWSRSELQASQLAPLTWQDVSGCALLAMLHVMTASCRGIGCGSNKLWFADSDNKAHLSLLTEAVFSEFITHPQLINSC